MVQDMCGFPLATFLIDPKLEIPQYPPGSYGPYWTISLGVGPQSSAWSCRSRARRTRICSVPRMPPASPSSRSRAGVARVRLALVLVRWAGNENWNDPYKSYKPSYPLCDYDNSWRTPGRSVSSWRDPLSGVMLGEGRLPLVTVA